MREDEAYLRVAQRYLESCEQHIAHNINIQEVIGFKAYHSFESIGGALCSHYGNRVPRSHVRKLNAFVATANNSPNINYRIIAILAMTLSSMRNKYLYPENTGTTFDLPENQISISHARKLVKRIRGIIRQIEQII